MLLQMAGYSSFVQLDNILLYVAARQGLWARGGDGQRVQSSILQDRYILDISNIA